MVSAMSVVFVLTVVVLVVLAVLVVVAGALRACNGSSSAASQLPRSFVVSRHVSQRASDLFFLCNALPCSGHFRILRNTIDFVGFGKETGADIVLDSWYLYVRC